MKSPANSCVLCACAYKYVHANRVTIDALTRLISILANTKRRYWASKLMISPLYPGTEQHQLAVSCPYRHACVRAT